MKILALDTSCDDSCAAIIDTDRERILADVVHSHVVSMEKYGGIVPEIASREHLKALPLAVHEALSVAGCGISDIDGIAVTHQPGLIGALLVGVSFAKALALATGRPFYAMNHIEAHLFSPFLGDLDGNPAPAFPWIALVVSGGHTEIFHVKDALEFSWLGGTLDDAAGEAFDKVGKLLGLPYPAGPQIDRWVAEKGTEEDRSRFQFPRARTEGYHFSFSGLKTAVAQRVKGLGVDLPAQRLAIAASAQEAIIDSLIDKVTKAASACGVRQIVITGGVACNSRLRSRLSGAYFPQPRHCADNAAMVARLASLYVQRRKLIPASWETTASASVDFS